MELFVTSTVIVLLFFLSARQLINTSRGIDNPGMRARLTPYVLISCAAFLFTECVGGVLALERVSLGLAVALASLLISSFTLAPMKLVKVCAVSVIGLEVLLSVLNIVRMTVPDLPDEILPVETGRITALSITAVSLMYIYSVALRLRDVKSVMRIGAPWSTVCICVDSLYMVCYVTSAAILLSFEMMTVYIVCMAAMATAVSARIRNASAFVLWTEHENRIIESMRISQLESLNESPGVDVLYRTIYDRVLEYFEKNKPYLNNDLTINDIVAVVFANKLYISKAISHYTGRNFCQFVNYHRVCHAVELFREDPTLKIVDMANKSGFNSAVSFSTAFRLFMGDKPGDWCRKERIRLSKLKK